MPALLSSSLCKLAKTLSKYGHFSGVLKAASQAKKKHVQVLLALKLGTQSALNRKNLGRRGRGATGGRMARVRSLVEPMREG